MPNLYGVATPGSNPFYTSTIGNVDVVTTAGIETNVINSPPNPPFQPGLYYAYAFGVLWISLGATPPTFLNVSLRISSGSDVAQVQSFNAALVANANLIYPYTLLAQGTPIQNPSPATTLQVSVTAGGQAVTVRGPSSYAWLQWYRGPDQ